MMATIDSPQNSSLNRRFSVVCGVAKIVIIIAGYFLMVLLADQRPEYSIFGVKKTEIDFPAGLVFSELPVVFQNRVEHLVRSARR
jgi:hypothetical protein